MNNGPSDKNTGSENNTVRKLMIAAVWIILGVAILLSISVVVIGRDNFLAVILGPVKREQIDFTALGRHNRPNRYLVCPPQYCNIAPMRVSPTFDERVTVLRDRWMEMIKRQPRVRQIAVSADKLQFDYEQRSKLFRFPDTVTLRIIPVRDNQTTLAILSRSHYGHSDFGVNRKRIESWLAELSATGK